jgi:two-component system, NarL family, response regulator DegU
MNKEKFNVYLADDHSIVRKGMIRLIGTFDRVGKVKEASNGKELMKLIEEQPPDAVILDVEMPVMGGVEAAKLIAERYPGIKILILTMHTEEVFVSKLLDIGVHGFLSKSAEPQEVETALNAIMDKDFYRNEIVANALAHATRSLSEEKYGRLTNREIEVLLLICEELTPGEISARLQISEKTFFNHRSNILEKTKARNNVGLIRFALQRKFINFNERTTVSLA